MKNWQKNVFFLYQLITVSLVNAQRVDTGNLIHQTDNKPILYFLHHEKDTFYLKRSKPFQKSQFYDNDFINICVKEITDTSEVYSYDSGNLFSYSGNIVGGIKNLLQTYIHSTPHLRFINLPEPDRFSSFYGHGLNIMGNKIWESNNCIDDSTYVDGRSIILKILASRFDFKVSEIADSLDVIHIITIDSVKLNSHRTPEIKQPLGGWARIDSVSQQYISTCAPFLFLATTLEKRWNIFSDDYTHTDLVGFDFQIPMNLLDSIEKFPELNSYLEENIGIKIIKKKELRKIFVIEFNNP